MQAAATAIGALEGEVAGLGSALRQSQGEVGRLQSDLAAAQASGSEDEVQALRLQLADASQALLNLEAAAHSSRDFWTASFGSLDLEREELALSSLLCPCRRHLTGR